MKKLIIIAALGFIHQANAQGSLGDVVGNVVEKGTTKGVYGAQVFILDQDRKYIGSTDADGRFRISAIPAGEYLLNIKYYGDTMSGIKVKVPIDGYYNTGNINFKSGVLEFLAIDVKADDGSIKLQYGELPVKEISALEIDKSPLKFDVKGLIASMGSDVRLTDDGELVFRGARKNDMLYLVDGVKASEIGGIPGVAIGRMMVYTGGLPAKYGDTMGGVVVLETKSYFDLYRQWEAEEIKKGNR
ncbi:MAG: TonB-dependent receptor [Crocinitomicaceae bacterium]|jgi:hypothetical protein|nr:TonB-dependent receptor [Crocinitomicaceae bacterium]MDP4684121.1 TonB-dependent receptor [Crocinitomicaceae bacterium]MDP4866875.1 TonB-dependent receptor [Crocinitomicaceae bacterium]MDP5009812.1 TonB-dependent receptor [Crocinitomicaceae bacterium]